MKRDNDYIRTLLFSFEAQSEPRIVAVATMDPSKEEIGRNYHINLLCDASLMVQTAKGVYRLTSQGHDFIDAVRDEGIWRKTKNAVAVEGGSAALEIIKSIAMAFLKKQLEERTGLKI